MRKNEYTSLDEFRSQYVGIWGPSDGHWFGFEFAYNGNEYRFHTGSMYNPRMTVLPDGQLAEFGLYRRNTDENAERDFTMLEEFATMDDALKSTCIEGRPFAEVIMDDDTVLLAQD